MEEEAISAKWNYSYSVCGNASTPAGYSGTTVPTGTYGIGPAAQDIKGLYCPTRRGGVRKNLDNVNDIMPYPNGAGPAEGDGNVSWWTGGGTDYGGCAGRHIAFGTSNYNVVPVVPASGTANYGYPAPANFLNPDGTTNNSQYLEGWWWGIFGRVNRSTTFAEIRDGLTGTIMLGEMQRITRQGKPYNGTTSGPKYSVDGWAVGGPATTFTTGVGYTFDAGLAVDVATPGPLMNNSYFMSPGSMHSGGANFCFADGSVKFLPSTMDPKTFAFAGSMADNQITATGSDDIVGPHG
jgi:prepilin-type processing-associated H-X9-DG protein